MNNNSATTKISRKLIRLITNIVARHHANFINDQTALDELGNLLIDYTDKVDHLEEAYRI